MMREIINSIVNYPYEVIRVLIVLGIVYSLGIACGEHKLVRKKWNNFRNKLLNDEIEVISCEFFQKEYKEHNGVRDDYVKVYYRYKSNNNIGYYRIVLDNKKIIYRYKQKELIQVDIDKKNIVYVPYEYEDTVLQKAYICVDMLHDELMKHQTDYLERDATKILCRDIINALDKYETLSIERGHKND